MGQYVGKDKGGAPILFRIKGDKPDPAEMGRINNILTNGPPQTSVAPEVAPEAPGLLEVAGKGIAGGYNRMQAGGDQLMQSFYETLGNDPVKAKQWEQAAREQMAEAHTYDVPEGGFFQKVVSTLGESAPAQVAGLAGMRVGAGVGAAIGGAFGGVGAVPGAIIGGAIGGIAAYAPTMLNANAERQIEEHGHVNDWGKAYTATGLGGVVEHITDKITFGLAGALTDAGKIAYKTVTKGGAKAATKITEKTIREATKNAVNKSMTVAAKRIGLGAAGGAVTGAAEEALQANLERWQAELPLMGPEAQKEYLESALMGAITEGIFGGGAGVYGAHKQVKNAKALAEALNDAEAESVGGTRAAEANVPGHAARREAKYAEPPPSPEPVRKEPIEGQLMLPDYSAPTREQTYKEESHTHESLLPPGLRDKEVGTDPLESAGEQPTSLLTEARKAITPVPDRSRMSREEYKAAVQAREAEIAARAPTATERQGALDLAESMSPETTLKSTQKAEADRTAPQYKAPEPAPQIRPAPTTPSTETPRIGEHGPAALPFSHQQYLSAIDTLRDEGTLSHDKIAKTLGVSKAEAAAYFNEMLKNNDAHPAGDHNQYAKITVPKGMSSRKQSNVRGKMQPYRARDYIVKPVRAANGSLPYSVSVNGKKMGQKGGNTFATRQEAQDFIDNQVPAKVKKNATISEDTSGIQYGIYEQHYEHRPDKEQRLVGEQVVNTYMTEAEAREAVKGYDPAYSPQTNKQKTEKKSPEERAAAINRDYEQEMGAPGEQLRAAGDTVLGKGRLKLQIVPRIVDPDNPDAIIEGSSDDNYETDPAGIRKLIGNVIRLSSDLTNPNLTEEQRTQLMQEVLNHELVHALRGLDLLTRQEWDTLFQHAASAKVPGKSYTWLQRGMARTGALHKPKPGEKPLSAAAVAEEAVAEMIRHYINDPTAFRNPQRNLLRKIADFIKKLMRLGERHDAADLIDTIFSGGIADREIGHGGLGPRNDDDVRYSLIKPENFYLKTARFIDGIKQEKAPAAQWKAMLKNAGIREEERNWLGLDDWLDDLNKDELTKTVYKQDIQNFIKASDAIEIRVLAKSSHPDFLEYIKEQKQNSDEYTDGGYGTDPEYGQLQTAGGQDYAEAIFSFTGKPGEPAYENHHYPYENMLAHVRFKTVVEDGKRILFIEEIQSDLHQDAGKVGGYYSEALLPELNRLRDKDAVLSKASNEAYDLKGKLERSLRDAIRLAGIVESNYRFHKETNGRSYAAMAGMDVEGDLKRASEEVKALRQLSAEANTNFELVDKEFKENNKEYGKLKKRMRIPNAPYKTGWEDYVIKRMIRHAAEHGYDAVGWHGQPESVAAVEKWPGFTTEQTETGPRYFVGTDAEIDPATGKDKRPNVTSIVNRYIEKLPRIVRKLANAFGANVTINDADPRFVASSGKTAYTPPEFYFEEDIKAVYPTKGSIKSKIHSIEAALSYEEETTRADKQQQADLIKRMNAAYQHALSQRGEFDPVKAFEAAGLVNYNYDIHRYEAVKLQEIDVLTQEDGMWMDVLDWRKAKREKPGEQASTGSFPWKNFRLDLNRDMKQSFIEGEQTRFSMVMERKQEIMADPNFQQWFGQGVVTDDDDTPKVVYHYTKSDQDFGRFNRLTHFGTAQAAEDRMLRGLKPERLAPYYPHLKADQLRALNFENFIEPKGQRVYPAFLNLRRPLHIADDKSNHNAFSYGFAMNKEGVLSDAEFKRIMALRTNEINNFTPEGEKAALTEIVKAMEKAGYDGFSYINQGEDIGSTSYVALHPQQIKSIFNQGAWSEDPDTMYSRLEARGADLLENDDKFKHWFNGSRIVDEKGNPWLMFHGTYGDDFDAFGEDAIGSNADEGIHGRGFYFTEDPDHGNTYAGKFDKRGRSKLTTGSRVIPVFLSIKNPYIANPNSEPVFGPGEAKTYTDKLKKQGYDGILVRNVFPDVYGNQKYEAVVAFHPNQIKSALAEEFSKESDSFKYSMIRPQYSATAPLGQRVPTVPPPDQLAELHNRMTYDNLSQRLHRFLEWIIPGAARKEFAKGKVDDTIIALQDRMLSVGRLIDRMKKNGGFITNENDVYLREQLYSSQVDAHLQANDRDYYKKLSDAVAGLNVTQRDVDDAKTLDTKVALILNEYKNPKHALAELFVYARHAQERNALMRERNEALAARGERVLQHEAGSGMGDGTAQMVLQWFDSKSFGHEFSDLTNANSIRSLMRKLNRSTNDIRVDSGLSIDYRTTLHPTTGTPLQNYEDYAPIRGRIDEAITYRGEDEINDFFAKTGKGFNIRGNEDFAALGRVTLGTNLIAHAIMQNQEAIVRAGKNKVAQSFRQLILDNPAAMSSAAEIIDRPPTKYYFDKKRGVVKEILDNKMMTDPKVLKGKVGGQMFFIRMKDPKIARAMGEKSGLGTDTGMPTLFKGLLGVNRFLAATRTSWNPEFVVANVMRDLEAAMINLSEQGRAGVRRKVVASVFPAMKGVWKSVHSGNMTDEWAKVHDEFRRHGGHTANLGIRELSDTLKKMNGTLSEDMSGNMSKVKKPIRTIFKFIEDYNLAAENGTRLAAYKVLRDQYLELSGDPHNPQNQLRAREMAAWSAKNLTVNFNMGGESKSMMSALYMFFNASMQGTLALLNPLMRSRRMKMVWASVLTAGAVQDMMMSMLSPEDEDGEKTYDKIPEHVLEHNMVMMDPFGITERGYFAIPMPYLMNGIYNFGRASSRAARGKYTAGELLSTGGMTLIDSLNPLGGANSLLNLVMPSIADPVVDLYMNEDFTGKPIAPPVSPYETTGEARSQQYWNNTNPLYVSIADWMSTLTGRDGDYIPGKMEASPNQVQYAVDWVTGGTGTFLARASVLMYGGATGELENMEIDAGDVPFLRKVYGSITKKNDLQDYIEGRDQVLRIRKALQDARKEGDNDSYMRIMREYPKEYKIASRVNALENARKKLSTKIKKIRESKNLTDEQKEVKVKELKARQDLIVGRGNDVLAAID